MGAQTSYFNTQNKPMSSSMMMNNMVKAPTSMPPPFQGFMGGMPANLPNLPAFPGGQQFGGMGMSMMGGPMFPMGQMPTSNYYLEITEQKIILSLFRHATYEHASSTQPSYRQSAELYATKINHFRVVLNTLPYIEFLNS